MKKILVISLAVVLVIGLSGIVNAGIDESNAEKGLSASPAFEETDDGHFTHQNGAPRIGAGEGRGRIAIEPSEPGVNSDDNSAISEHGDDSLIDTTGN